MNNETWTTEHETTFARLWWSGAGLKTIDEATGNRCTVERDNAQDKYHLLVRKVYGWLTTKYGAAYIGPALPTRAGHEWSQREVDAIKYMREQEAKEADTTYLSDIGYLARLFHRRPSEVSEHLNPPEEDTLGLL